MPRNRRPASSKPFLDTATDGVLIIDRDGKITGINKSAEALFGFDFAEIQNASFTMLFAPESHRAAVDYLDGLASNGVASVLNDGREVVGRERQGGLIPLFMTIGKIGEDSQKFCAVLRDITQWKRAEEELDRRPAPGRTGKLAQVRLPREDQPRNADPARTRSSASRKS